MTPGDGGRPLAGIVQVAYTVPDVEQAMRDYTARLGAGPWFVRGPFVPPEGRYRGQPTDVRLTLARGFAGPLMVELIEQHSDVPSVYHEAGAPRRYGFHHWARFSSSLDADIERYRALGAEVAFSDRLPTGARVVYVDTRAHLAGMIELIERTEDQERAYRRMRDASTGTLSEKCDVGVAHLGKSAIGRP